MIPTAEDVERARRGPGGAHSAYITMRVDWRGPAVIGDLDCRVCWSTIVKGADSVETGYAAMHAECYEALMANRHEYTPTEDDYKRIR